MQFLLAFLWTGLAWADGPAYHWPMDARPALTSTFGEYRPGRFHGGIDLKTWGQVGYPVRAVDDGCVSRIRTSPWGYGRAVYMKLRDGRTALYAHLSAFASPIAERAEAEQERKVAYSVDIFPKDGEIPVSRGQIVGFSGSSGVGMPHLHFELRDEAERPINALEHGLAVADTIPPIIRALALVPLNATSLVNGGHDPHPFQVTWSQEQKHYLSPQRVCIHGRIGVAADVFDQADASASENKLAPYRLKLLVDSAEVFETTYSGFSYSENHLVELDRNFALSRRGAGHFHNLFRAKGNRLSLYGGYQEGDGVLRAGVESNGHGVALKPGPHLLQVVTEDISGNRSEAEVEILVDAPPEARRGGLRRVMWGNDFGINAKAYDVVDTATFTCTPTIYPDFTLLRVETDRAVQITPTVTVTWPNARSDTLAVRQTDLRSYEAVVSFDPEVSGDVTVTVFGALPGRTPTLIQETGVGRGIIPAVVFGRRTLTLTQQTVTASGGSVRSADGVALARFNSNKVYQPLFARAEAVQATGRPDLPLIGTAYRFAPDDVPFDGRAELTLRYPAGYDRPERLGVYRRAEDGTWRFLGNRVDLKAGTVSAEVSSFSTYGLLLDEVPPIVTDLRPASGTEVSDPRPELSATIRDAGSGIGREEDIALLLNGRRLISEYDPDRETVAARPKQPLRPGQHRLEVTVRDMCGNETRASSTFTIQ